MAARGAAGGVTRGRPRAGPCGLRRLSVIAGPPPKHRCREIQPHPLSPPAPLALRTTPVLAGDGASIAPWTSSLRPAAALAAARTRSTRRLLAEAVGRSAVGRAWGCGRQSGRRVPTTHGPDGMRCALGRRPRALNGSGCSVIVGCERAASLWQARADDAPNSRATRARCHRSHELPPIVAHLAECSEGHAERTTVLVARSPWRVASIVTRSICSGGQGIRVHRREFCVRLLMMWGWPALDQSSARPRLAGLQPAPRWRTPSLSHGVPCGVPRHKNAERFYRLDGVASHQLLDTPQA